MGKFSTAKAAGRFNGEDLKAMFVAALDLLERNMQSIDMLNVFPVPDGDTGTNMCLTMREMMDAVENAPDTSLQIVSAAMSEASMMGSRGNSGVILSQLFKGMATAFADSSDFGPHELASAYDRARDFAYNVIGDPVQGTMLTVMDHVADCALKCAEDGFDIPAFSDSVCDAARNAVALTPSMLSVLAEAGLVDAGGHGLSVILEGVRNFLTGRDLSAYAIVPPAPVTSDSPGEIVSPKFLDSIEHESYGYCTNLMIHGENLDPDAVRNRMAILGNSPVVIGEGEAIKVHVHASDPGPVISFAVSLGTLSQVKIENMDDQRAAYTATLRALPKASGEHPDQEEVSLVAVAWGAGLERVFEGLGISQIVPGGDTMNPSVQDILEAVECAETQHVIFLPNNKNIIPAAKQAATRSTKTVEVVPSATIPQGITAVLEFKPTSAMDENVREMTQALSSVRTGEVCRAVRATDLNGRKIPEGTVIGLLERELVSVNDDPADVLMSLLSVAGVNDGDLVTLYWGADITPHAAKSALERASKAFPAADFEVVEGGQPAYMYIVSIE